MNIPNSHAYATSEQLPYWLALNRIPGLGAKRVADLLTVFGNVKQIFQATPDILLAQGVSESLRVLLKTPDWISVDRDLAWMVQRTDRAILTWADPRYPALLREIASAPLVLFVQGDATIVTKPQLAMVGSRNPTHTGRELAYSFASALAQAGFVITSGLALGIDAASHEGALAAKGNTIAVMGTGLDQIYPRRHSVLAKQISESGAIVSEFPIGSLPKAEHFPRRNRVISGLSVGVLVVEAALQSGSLITARFATEQGREVFAIPGSIHSPLARGCHYLLRQGAKLVESVTDILEELQSLLDFLQQPAATHAPSFKTVALDDAHAELLACIAYETTSLDLLVQRSGLTADIVSSMLLSLEWRGYISVVSGGYARNI